MHSKLNLSVIIRVSSNSAHNLIYAFKMQNSNTTESIIWNPLLAIEPPIDYQFAIVVLNQPIHLHHQQVLPLWEKAQVTVTVDGGTNQWMDYLGERAASVLNGQCKKYLPKLVTGDMDSISAELLNQLKCTEADVVVTLDDSETDYTKALITLSRYTSKNNIKLDGILVFAETAGRLDQIVANINTLYRCDQILSDTLVMQIAHNSLTWLLKTGIHRILIPEVILKSQSWCALIPFGNSNNCITTTGLKYNLDKTCMRFDSLISTSNAYGGQPTVTVNTDVPIIWAMGIEALTKVGEM